MHTYFIPDYTSQKDGPCNPGLSGSRRFSGGDQIV
jgi:hypothetical protein